jgi:hypothetical protein
MNQCEVSRLLFLLALLVVVAAAAEEGIYTFYRRRLCECTLFVIINKNMND